MKKWLQKRLRDWLFPDIIELANAEVKKLRVEIEPIEKRIDFLGSCSKINKDPAFHKAIDELVERQIQYSVQYAENWERVLFHRATINGFNLVKEEMQDLADQFLEITKPEEEFNKHDII